MAINPESLYPGKITPGTADYPYGAARNITLPGDGTGTPWDAALVNDIFGFQQAMLGEASLVPSGSPEKVGASQYLQALERIFAGRSVSGKETVADMVADSNIKPPAIVSTEGHGAAGDGGHNVYLIEAKTGDPEDGGSVIFMADGTNQATGLFPGDEYDSRQWGATGSGDESTKYQAAVDYLIASGKRCLTVDVDHDTNMTIDNRSNVVFRGKGSFKTTNGDTGTYRRQVVPTSATVANAYPDERMGVELNRIEDAKIVVTGDSLTTFSADALTAADGFTQRIIAEITSANPDVAFEFVGRGIGAQKWDNLDDLPSTSYPIADRYPWYYDDMRPWLDYIFDEDPDFVIISMGINDQQNLNREKVESVVAKIEATGARVILVTNLGVNLSPHPDNATFGTYDAQEGRDYAAGWIRTYAQYHDYPCIDMNRTFNLMRDGRDILDTYLIEMDEDTYPSPQQYVAPDAQRCRDFSIRADIDAAGWTNPNPISVVLSTGTNNAVFIDDDGGFLRFRFYRGDSSSLYLTVTSDIPTPEASAEVEISVRGNQFSFRIIPPGDGNLAGVQPFTQKVIRYGGLTIPSIFYFGGGGSGPVTRAQLSMGVEKLYIPALTDVEMFGEATLSTQQKAVTGGNGVNHPTSQGSTFIYGAHFSAQDYRWDRGVEVTTDGQGVCYRYADGTQVCEAIINAAAGATTAEGSMFVGAVIGWVFAKPFIAAPIISGSADRYEFDLTFNDGGGTAELSNGVRARATTSLAMAVNLRVSARGRWKA